MIQRVINAYLVRGPGGFACVRATTHLEASMDGRRRGLKEDVCLAGAKGDVPSTRGDTAVQVSVSEWGRKRVERSGGSAETARASNGALTNESRNRLARENETRVLYEAGAVLAELANTRNTRHHPRLLGNPHNRRPLHVRLAFRRARAAGRQRCPRV